LLGSIHLLRNKEINGPNIFEKKYRRSKPLEKIMRKIALFLSIPFLASTCLVGQEVKITWSKEITTFGIPVLAKDKLYCISKKFNSEGEKGVYRIEVFDKNLTLIKKDLIANQWDIHDKNQVPNSSKMCSFGNTIYCYSGFTKYERWGEAKIFTLNADNKDIVAENIQSVAKQANIKNIKIIISAEKSKIAYLGLVKKAPKNFVEANHVTVTDEKGNLIWSDSIGIISEGENICLKQLITGNGDLVFLTRQEEQYFVYTYAWKTKQVKSFQVNPKENKLSTQPCIQITDQGQIEIAQFVTNNATPVIAGYEYALYNMNLQELQKNFIPLNTASIQFEDVKTDPAKGSAYDYSVENILHTSTGKTIVIIERGLHTHDEKNRRRDIVIACQQQNKLLWNSIIARNLNSYGVHEHYLCKLKGEDVYFLYNDDYRNFQTNKGSELQLMDDIGTNVGVYNVTVVKYTPAIVLAHIDQQGQLTKKEVKGPIEKKACVLYVDQGGNFSNDNWAEDQDALYFTVENLSFGTGMYGPQKPYIGKIEF
jgi:hypothetical protein